MKKIQWRPVKDAELYWVSTDGRVKTFKNNSRIILRPSIEKGYPRVRISERSVRVHRLVAIAFLRPKPGFNEVNHINPNKLNNNHTNLEWTNRLGNMQHCDRLGLREFRSGEDHGGTKLTKEQVLEMRRLYQSGLTSYPKLSREYGVSISSAQRIVTKKTWKYL